MSLSMHEASVPAFTRQLGAMLNWLDKAQAHAEARKFDAGNYLGLRLAPDRLPFSRQIQISCDFAKGCVARLPGHEVPKWDDNEASLDDLRARIRKTIDYVQSVPVPSVDEGAVRAIVLPLRVGDPLHFTGKDYVTQFVLPNFYFHATAAYALLRHAGVEIGKRDFLGR
ncbi:MAG: DUF1993 domain-containing protein [Leptothrix sp. (in: Bacteria)]|nr:DUF1993 domain-containing protein [Leptothrix sp. (in: b-proteobacteria)]